MDGENKTASAAEDAIPKESLIELQKNSSCANDNKSVLEKDNNDIAKVNLLANSEIEHSSEVSEVNFTSPIDVSNTLCKKEKSISDVDDGKVIGNSVLSNENKSKQDNLNAIELKIKSDNDINLIETENNVVHEVNKSESEVVNDEKGDDVKCLKIDHHVKEKSKEENSVIVSAESKQNILNDFKLNEKKSQEDCEPMSVEATELSNEQRMDVDPDDQHPMEIGSKDPSPILDDIDMEAEESTLRNTSNEVLEVLPETTKNDDKPLVSSANDFGTVDVKNESKKMSSDTVETIIDISSSEDDIHDNKQIGATPNLQSPKKIDIQVNTVSNNTPSSVLTTETIPDSTYTNKNLEISKNNVQKLAVSPRGQDSSPLKTIYDGAVNTTPQKIDGEKKCDESFPNVIDTANKMNGIINVSADEDDNSNLKTVDHSLISTTLKTNYIYKVNITYEMKDVKFLSVERIGENQMLSSNLIKSVNESSNGAAIVENVTSTNNLTDGEHSDKKHTFESTDDLCNFMINKFSKIKELIQTKMDSEQKLLTPDHNQKPNYHGNETPSSTKSKRSRKRSAVENENDSPKTKQVKRDLKETPRKEIDDRTPKAKLVKHDIKETPKKEIDDEDAKKTCVLAKWIDKKFYAGRVVGEKLGKFIIRFEDGAQKTLPKESIVFGSDDTLPLLGQSVFANVDEDFEVGTVTTVENVDNKIIYTVKTPNKTVQVTASDLYLQDDQAKIIQKLNEEKSGRPIDDLSRSSRNKRLLVSPSTPEAGYSGGIGKRNKRQKRQPPKEVIYVSNSSTDDDDIPQSKEKPKSTILSPVRGIELIEGVQPELQKSFHESELSKLEFFSDYGKHQPDIDIDDILGPTPITKTMFRGKCFLLTCTVGLKPHRFASEQSDGCNEKFRQFSNVPFVKSHLEKQIEEAGGKVYQYFEDVPKGKYRQCKLIAPRPCLTAKFVQCLAANIPAISHEWIIDSCRQNKATDVKKYSLPAGWSVINEKFVKWKIGKSCDERLNSHPFEKSFILIAGIQNDFIEFWSRVCKLAGGKIRYIKTISDVTPTTQGYMIAESDFSKQISSKATYFGIPIISTFWVVQSLILGYICPPDSHPKLVEVYQDDEI